jgi:uncharacterized protein (TIGR03435 family)
MKLPIAGALIAAVLAAPPLLAQTSAGANPKASFEVASVRPNNSGSTNSRLSAQPGGRVTATNVTVRMLLRASYRLQPYQMVGGPAWLDSDRFDIVAKAEGDPDEEQLQLMLQSLLAERFGFAAHRETRELPVYALVLARPDGKTGPQLRPSDIDCEALARTKTKPPPPPPPTASNPSPVGPCSMRAAGGGRMSAGAATMTQLAGFLSGPTNRMVVDRSGLAGAFDIDLQWTPDQTADTSGPSIFTALQEQLGLKLESQRAPVDVLVIDRVEQPTPD